ncbi:MAG TPA: isoprenylcysteine carboxylmethyltransferase family protein [Terriglobales bacterium]|jgi:protein-S-isoprenylcysteine O-methyltransferase Ste14|nr:isoprenylcysteine carboxylmethyltransferase family protein [Terriglobales bacterium]
MLATLRTAGWLFAIVLSTIPSFWLLVHPRAEYWRNRRGARFRILAALWVAMLVGAGAITWRWRRVALYEGAASWLAAAPFLAAGLYIYYGALATLSLAQLTGRSEVEGDRFEQRLVTSGLYSRVRHPVYVGHLCELIGWSFGTGLVVIYVLTGFALVTGAVMIRMEDDELERRFGEQYRRYRQTTPAIIPRLIAGAAKRTTSENR